MKVNSYNEWSPLREMIVGSPVNFNLSNLELSFKLFFHDSAFLAFYYPSYEAAKDDGDDVTGDQVSSERIEIRKPTTMTLKRQYLEELAEDVDELVQMLEKEAVLVHRPTPLNTMSSFKTPYWDAIGIPALNVRDQAIILGDEILETPPQIRARYFENDLLKPV